jgi:hypothetical protein
VSRITGVHVRLLFRRHSLGASVVGVLLAACSGAPQPPKQPPGHAPTATTITTREPGGDASDPHGAALERLLAAPWGARNDKGDQLWAPTPDWGNWTRVRYFGFQHFTGFRYGDDHHMLAVVFVQDVPEGTPMKSETCMRRFESWGFPQTQGLDVKFGTFVPHFSKWRKEPLEIHAVDGHLNFAFTSADFSAAWAAYPAYPNACLIYAVAVPWREHRDLAQKLRDRFVNEGFPMMTPRTAERPVER